MYLSSTPTKASIRCVSEVNSSVGLPGSTVTRRSHCIAAPTPPSLTHHHITKVVITERSWCITSVWEHN